MQTQLIIAGVKQYKGVIDGSEFDHTKLIVMLPFSKSRAEVNQGFDVIEANYGKASNFAQFAGRKFPITCMGEIEMSIGSGGRQTTDVLSVELPKV